MYKIRYGIGRGTGGWRAKFVCIIQISPATHPCPYGTAQLKIDIPKTTSLALLALSTLDDTGTPQGDASTETTAYALLALARLR